MSRPPDGLTLEQIVGELQSDWGVPQSPQEFRITLKVAEERSRGGTAALVEERSDPEDPEELAASGATDPAEGESGARVRREKAPAAPRVGAVEGSEEEGGETRRKRRRSRRRRRGGKAH